MKICFRCMKMHQLNTTVFLLKLHQWHGVPPDSGFIKSCHVLRLYLHYHQECKIMKIYAWHCLAWVTLYSCSVTSAPKLCLCNATSETKSNQGALLRFSGAGMQIDTFACKSARALKRAPVSAKYPTCMVEWCQFHQGIHLSWWDNWNHDALARSMKKGGSTSKAERIQRQTSNQTTAFNNH